MSEHGAVTQARDLAELRQQIQQARIVLAELHAAAVEAERRQGDKQADTLLAANEQLVMTALRAQTEADAAAQTLNTISRLGEIDALTELPNRVSLLDRLKYAIAIAKRTGTQIALLFVDLNNFKQVNDTLGHPAGDEVLRLAAKRLGSAVRESDTVSRYGGDEFLILLTDITHPTDVVQIAVKLIAALGPPIRIDEHILRLTASIGISLFPNDGEVAATLIERADSAMYRAKRSGGGGFAFYGNVSTDNGQGEPRILPALHYPLNHYRAALAEQARRHAQLREANEQLVLAALDAQKLRDAAEQAQRRQADFLAVLAHELRNPLVPMQQVAALLHQARLDGSLLPRIQGVIERQVAQMSRLVSDLLDVSRVSSGKLRLERHTLDLVAIIDDAVNACRPCMDARLQHFTVQISPGPLEVHGDPVRLAQILSNLLDNASKYTKDGGDIRFSVVANEHAIVLTVSDTGIGISAESLSTIFEPFMQGINAIGFNGGGLGIGLTVVRELVQAHGGTICAGSDGIDLGSTFVVTLPRTGGDHGLKSAIANV
ncbi:MAG: diguanylate cyclase [Pseudomonadota bacterium]|nr:diguanylate cyclase [Pseudomonadota bacterium]